MSPLWSYSEKDLLRGKVLTPGWYRIRIDSIGESPAKITEGKKPTTNYPVEATVLFNADNGDTEFAGVPLEYNFNSGAMGFTIGFLRAFGVEIKAGARFDPSAAIGKEVDAYIGNREWQGRILNDVKHQYRAPREDVQAV